MKKWIFGSLLLLCSSFIGYQMHLLLGIITGYAAKNMCSAVFISQRDEDSVRLIDLNFSPICYAHTVVNYDNYLVESRLLWRCARAIYRPNCGACLVRDVSADSLRRQKYPIEQERVADGVEELHYDTSHQKEAREITHQLMSEHAYGGMPFAFVALWKGRLIAEGYKAGIDRDTRLLSWSMAKSMTNALTGIMVLEYDFDLYAPVNLPEWQHDERKQINVNDLLQMQSGLSWNENYGGVSDVIVMLHMAGDMAAYTIKKDACCVPGKVFDYASGSTNVASYVLRKALSNDSLYYDLAVNKLFRKIGAKEVIFETDVTGTMLGSCYVYARAVDYARFGQLYMKDGVVGGERVLPEGWVRYTTTPATQSMGNYGSGFWLNTGGRYPLLERDVYSCEGHDGQFVVIVPSHDLVVTVLGFSPRKTNPLNIEMLVVDLIALVDKVPYKRDPTCL